VIGGTVSEVVWLEDRIWVEVVDPSESGRGDLCAIYVRRCTVSEEIKVGDSLWWQGGYAYWTPFREKLKAHMRSGFDYDLRIPKIGYSGVARPETK
jgi:hypothetical protein